MPYFISLSRKEKQANDTILFVRRHCRPQIMFEVWTCRPKVRNYTKLSFAYVLYSLLHNLFRVKLAFKTGLLILKNLLAPVISYDTTHNSRRLLYMQVFIAIYRIAHSRGSLYSPSWPNFYWNTDGRSHSNVALTRLLHCDRLKNTCTARQPWFMASVGRQKGLSIYLKQ